MKQVYQGRYATYAIKDEILYVTFNEHLEMTYEVALTIVNERLSFQSFKHYAVICIIPSITSITREARNYLSLYGSSLLKQVALVCSNSTLYTMAEFYIEIDSPKVHTKVFHSLKQAEQYISFLKK